MIGEWLDIGPVSQISPGNARTLPVRGSQEIAEFPTLDNGFYALINSCPHKQGPLSQGTVHGNIVTCPLHNWNISLKTGEALGVDKGCVPTIPLRIDAGRIYLLRSAVVGRQRTETAEGSDLHLPIHPGSDVALMNGLLAWCRTHGATDEAYLTTHVATPDGFWDKVGEGSDFGRWRARAMCPPPSLDASSNCSPPPRARSRC